MTILHIADWHVIVPDIPCILLDADIGKVGSIAGRVVLIGIKSIDMKSF